MLKIDYRDRDQRFVISWQSGDNSLFLNDVRSLIYNNSDDTQNEGPYTLSVAPYKLFSLVTHIQGLIDRYQSRKGTEWDISATAATLVENANQDAENYDLARNSVPEDPANLQRGLTARGFVRELSDVQKRNVGKILGMPAAATFSVPGAGKTTEALAFFFFHAKDEDRLLVIAPKNAFAAWDEEKALCVPTSQELFVRLRGGRERIQELLNENPRFMLITYQQLTNVSELIASYCREHSVFMFLDESHRIKNRTGVHSTTVLGLSHLPIKKLILSGTPMPQSAEDLYPQFKFLYPVVSTSGSNTNLVELFRPVFVRTNKKELGLRAIETKVFSVPMDPLQRELYNLMSSETLRQARLQQNTPSRQTFRQLGRSVQKLLQFISNPALLASDMGNVNPSLLAAILADGDGPKIRAVLKRVRELAPQQKVLVWTSFVKNVEYLAYRLEDLGAVYIHGGVDSRNQEDNRVSFEEDDDTREGKIKQFHDNDDVRVLIANPAAASEGISLHKVCHHAIYLDRSFNAAHYMQSQDRIHRFGLDKNQETTIEILQCDSSVDETVFTRLNTKMGAMSRALEDSSIQVDPFPIDLPHEGDDEEANSVIDESDIQQLINDLESSGL